MTGPRLACCLWQCKRSKPTCSSPPADDDDQHQQRAWQRQVHPLSMSDMRVERTTHISGKQHRSWQRQTFHEEGTKQEERPACFQHADDDHEPVWIAPMRKVRKLLCIVDELDASRI